MDHKTNTLDAARAYEASRWYRDAEGVWCRRLDPAPRPSLAPYVPALDLLLREGVSLLGLRVNRRGQPTVVLHTETDWEVCHGVLRMRSTSVDEIGGELVHTATSQDYRGLVVQWREVR